MSATMEKKRLFHATIAALLLAGGAGWLVLSWMGRGPDPSLLANPELKDFPGYMEIRGRIFHLNPDDRIITLRMIRTGTWEPGTTQVFLDNVREEDTVIDVGANIGYYTILGADAVGPKGRVFAFEPDPTSHSFLKKNVEVNNFGNVVAEQKALSDRPGVLKLYLATRNQGDHQIFQTGDRQSVDVEAVALDDYLEDKPGPVHFIKIDTDGAEWAILNGMVKTLRRNKHIKLSIEFYPKGLAKFGADAGKLLDLLAGMGFVFKEIYDPKGTVTPRTRAELLDRFTVENGKFTNLFCHR